MSSKIFTAAQLAGRPQKGDTCFYCTAKVGQEHEFECVMRQKRVLVRYSVTLEIDVPEHWTAHDVEFSRNDSSWCADNAIKDFLQEHKKVKAAGSCWCSRFECECLNDRVDEEQLHDQGRR